MFWGQVHDVQRGRIKKFFSFEKPDRQGRYGYGFIQPIDADDKPIPQQPDVFFLVSHGCYIRASHVPGEMEWVRQWQSECGDILTPDPGNIVVYNERKGRNDRPEAVHWAYGWEYLAARTEATLMHYMLIDGSELGGVVWTGRFSLECNAAETSSGELPQKLTDSMVLYTDRRTDSSQYFTAEYAKNRWTEVCGGEGTLRSIRAALAN